MTTPHKHAALIKAWADGAMIQFKSIPANEWYDVVDAPAWGEHTEYRIKPEREFPKTSMTNFQIWKSYFYYRNRCAWSTSDHMGCRNCCITRPIKSAPPSPLIVQKVLDTVK